jgi:hypothetical protein
LGVPRVIRKALAGTTAFTLPAAPEAFWHCVQWQARNWVTGWLMVYWMAPQRQLPVRLSGMGFLEGS